MLLDRPGQMPALDRQSQISTPAWFEKSGARHLQSSRLCRAGYALVPLPASGNRGEVDVRMSPAISARRPQTLFWGRFFFAIEGSPAGLDPPNQSADKLQFCLYAQL